MGPMGQKGPVWIVAWRDVLHFFLVGETAMQWSAMEWIDGMQCSGVEWNGCILSILVILGRFAHFGLFCLTQKRHFKMSYLRAGFVGSFFGQKNAISKCQTFGQDLLGRPARLI